MCLEEKKKRKEISFELIFFKPAESEVQIAFGILTFNSFQR